MNRFNNFGLISWSALVVALGLTGSAHAADFIVDRFDDDTVSTCSAAANDCTLRGAVIAANATADNDTITVPASTYTLTLIGPEDAAATGDLDVKASGTSGTLTINGAGAGTTFIQAGTDASNGIDRVFHVLASGNLSLSALTIRNGKTSNGGGIYNTGTLTVQNSTVSNNSATSNGGGIYNTGTLTVQNSTVSNNSTTSGISNGGGIYSTTSNDFTTNFTLLRNSTLCGNTAITRGGGLYNFNGQTTVESCTVTANTAPSGSGSGIASFGDTLTRTPVSNSIVAGNRGPGGASGTDVDSLFSSTNSFVSNGYNLIGDGKATGAFNKTGDQVIGDSGDPKLGPVQDNGGPTQTIKLLAGSPAINAGSNALIPSGLTTDQRGSGFPRIKGGTVDIGAFEVQNDAPTDIALSNSSVAENVASGTKVGTFSTTDVDAGNSFTYSLPAGQSDNASFAIGGTNNDELHTAAVFDAAVKNSYSVMVQSTDNGGLSVTKNFSITVTEIASLVVTIAGDVTANDGETSLREAINYANSKANADANTPDEITFDATVVATAQTIQLGSGLPNISDNVKISGPGANLLTVQGGGGADPSDSFNPFIINTGKSLNISGLTISNGNSGIVNGGSVTASSCTFSGNFAGISSEGTVTLTNCTLSGNSGIGLLNNDTATLTNCTLSGNGGGIQTFRQCTATLTNCTVSGNDVGITNLGALTLKNTLIAGNDNAIDNANGTGTLTDGGGNRINGTAHQAGLETTDNNNAVVLKDNGGPTPTIALLAGSSAINAGLNANAAGLTTDQRGSGFPRIVGGTVDIGAYESSFVPPTLAISDVTANEGQSGTTTFQFTVTRSGDTSVTSSVHLQHE